MPYIEEKFELNQATAGVSESDGQGATWGDIWDFLVPLNTFIILRPQDVLSCYLVGDDTSQMPAATQIRVVRRDVANSEAKPLLANCLYQQVKAFDDKNKWKHLTVGGEVVVGPDEHIVVMVNGADTAGTGDTDASASYFKLTTTRRRRSLG